MKLIKVTPNQGRGTIPIYINSLEILRVDFGDDETKDGCKLTLTNGDVFDLFDKAIDIFKAVNS